MMQNNVKIAITGGICSGKSTVAKIICEQGYKVVSCDDIYCELLQDSDFINQLDKEFGNIKTDSGTLDRAKLSAIVFDDNSQLKKLNSLTHPKIMQRAMEQMSGAGVHFCEVPLLFEGGFEKNFDNVIVVLRDEDERVNELMNRNSIDKEQANLRLKAQFDYKNTDLTMYYVIHNNGDLLKLRKNTLCILDKLIKDYF